MFYQLLVQTNEKTGKSDYNKKITEVDIEDKQKIINDVIIPYLKNEEFIVNGYNLTKENIQRLKVCTTEKSAHALADYENKNMPRGVIIVYTAEDILAYDKYITDVTQELINESKELIKVEHNLASVNKENIDKNKVFIVHGHDNEAKTEVARFIEKLGFQAIILHEQVNQGMTIIEKIEQNTNVGFCVVLYTPCDVGYDKNNKESKRDRARQNVVFEHGYMLAKLGRKNVCALVKGNVEKPNDISGLIYINMDTDEGWKLKLAKEMKEAGYSVDLNLTL